MDDADAGGEAETSDADPSQSPLDLDDRLERFLDRDWDDGLRGDESADRRDPPLRIAMVGLGWWTREEALPAVAGSEYAETAVLVSGSREKAARVADATGVPHALDYEAFHAGEAAAAYDAVYVATPNATHLEHVAAAAALGKAVLCEKPVEATVERAERLVAACEERGVPLMVAYRMQTEPIVRLARALVREGWVGEPVQAHGADSATLLEINPDPGQWRLDADLSGGCALADLGVYPLNTLRFLLDADPVRVSGTTRSEHEAFAEVDEHVAFSCEFSDSDPGSDPGPDSGSDSDSDSDSDPGFDSDSDPGSGSDSDSDPGSDSDSDPGSDPGSSAGVTAVCTASHNAYGSGHLRVLGTAGRLTLDPVFHPWDPRRLTLERGGEAGCASVTVEPDEVDQMREEFDYFAHRVLTGRAPAPDGRHALADVRAVAGVYDSAAAGGAPVDVDP